MPIWIQQYDPFGNLALSALSAAFPLFLLFYLLAIKKMPGYKAAFFCTLSALAIAGLFWRMPLQLAASASLMGAAFGLFPIIWVVVTAIWIYNMTVECGEFEKIKHSLATLTDDRRLQAIFIAFSFSAFLEGASGFGTPVAICAAVLMGLGFNPFQAAAICLVANSAPAAFGVIGLPIIVSGEVAEMEIGVISRLAGFHLSILSFFLPLWICVILCGFKKSFEIWPALLTAGLSFALSMYLTARFNGPALPNIVAGLLSLAAMIALLRLWKPAEVWRFTGEAAPVTSAEKPVYGKGSLIRAWAPYLLLTLLVFIFSHADYKSMVQAFEPRLAWPYLHELVAKTSPIVSPDKVYGAILKLDILSASGTAIFLAGLISALIMPGYGLKRALACFGRSCKQMRFSILTICLVLSLAYIMNYSGMSSTLGLALTKTGFLFPFFAPIIGWVGVFLTGSDTSANALFSGLQRATGETLNLNPELMVAVNSSGGVTGKMISPQSISIATAATGQSGKEGTLFRFTLRHSLIMLLIVCLMTLIQSYC